MTKDAAMWEMADRMWERGDYGNCFQFLARGLDEVRTRLDSEGWRTFVEEARKARPIVRAIRSSPISWRTNAKPRGYAGDAETLDLLYGTSCPSHQGGAHPALYAGEFGGTPAVSVRERAMLLARFIDELCERRPGARILSVAAGHLREAGASYALYSGACGELVALDQDALSLQTIQLDYPELPIRTVAANVRRLIAGELDLGEFDGIYCAGLFDYLADRSAQRLAQGLFAALRPGGRLLLANFAPETKGIGFMECVQDWFLIYRDEEAMRRLLQEIPREDSKIRTFRDRAQCVVYLEAERAG